MRVVVRKWRTGKEEEKKFGLCRVKVDGSSGCYFGLCCSYQYKYVIHHSFSTREHLGKGMTSLGGENQTNFKPKQPQKEKTTIKWYKKF